MQIHHLRCERGRSRYPPQDIRAFSLGGSRTPGCRDRSTVILRQPTGHTVGGFCPVERALEPGKSVGARTGSRPREARMPVIPSMGQQWVPLSCRSWGPSASGRQAPDPMSPLPLCAWASQVFPSQGDGGPDCPACKGAMLVLRARSTRPFPLDFYYCAFLLGCSLLQGFFSVELLSYPPGFQAAVILLSPLSQSFLFDDDPSLVVYGLRYCVSPFTNQTSTYRIRHRRFRERFCSHSQDSSPFLPETALD